MAVVTAQKACGGPFMWETSNGVTKLKKQGICREVLDVSYDDECEIQERLYNGLHSIIVCDRCGKEARRLVNEREAAKEKGLNNWRSGKGRKQLKDKDMIF